MSYLISSSAGRVTDSRFPHSTFFEYSNSPSVAAAYYDEVQRRHDYNHYMTDERLTDCNSTSSFAIHQLLGLATRSSANGDFETVMAPYTDRRRHQPVMTSYVVDDAIIASDSACSYSNTTPSPVAMHELATRKDELCNKLNRRTATQDCCSDMVQSSVTSRDHHSGNCSYIARNDRVSVHYDDVGVMSYDEVRRRHHNYITSIGL